jgi:hypothetical protein
VNNNEIHHICVGQDAKKHAENSCTTQAGGKRQASAVEEEYIDLSTILVQI